MPNRTWLVGAAWPASVALVILVLADPTRSMLFSLALFALLGVAPPLLLLRVLWRRIATSELFGRLVLDADALRFDGLPMALREDLTEGVLVPAAAGLPTRVELKRHSSRSPIIIVPPTERDAETLLAALELDARHNTIEHRSLSGVQGLAPFRRSHTAVVLLSALIALRLAAFLGSPALLFEAPVAVFTVAAFVALFIPTRIRIGSDGVALRWLFWKRFIGIADIRGASRIVAIVNKSLVVSVRLALVSGEEVQLPIGGRDDESEALFLARRIEEARALHESRPRGARTSSVLRQGRSPLGWIGHLRTLGTGANADMRNAPVTKDELFALVEDPSGAPAARMGAAIALSRVISPFERKRIRIAARSSASPEARSALLMASNVDSTDVDLARELRRVEGGKKR